MEEARFSKDVSNDFFVTIYRLDQNKDLNPPKFFLVNTVQTWWIF